MLRTTALLISDDKVAFTMARLQKFNGTDSLPGVGSPQVVADAAVGAATAGLGQQIGRSAGAFGDLAEAAAARRRRQIDDFQVQKAQRELDAKLKEKATQEQRQAPPGGFGFTEAMMAHLEKSKEQMLKELPERSRPAFDQSVEARRDRYINGFATIEASENELYFRQGLEEEGARLAAEVRDNPEGLAEAFEQARTLIRAAPLPAQGKESAYIKIGETLAEAWAMTKPPEELLSAISDELARREVSRTEGSGNAFEPVDEMVAGTGDLEVFSEQRQVLAERLKLLPGETLGRMQVNAAKSRAATAAGEAERIASRIEASFGQFDASEIEANDMLEPRQKSRLIDQLDVVKEEHLANIEAANWLLSAEAHVPEPQRQKTADRAFTFLDDGEINRDSLARRIVETKGVLPEAYAAGLRKRTMSSNPEDIKHAYENLASILALAQQPALLHERGGDLVDRFEKWTLLTKHYGLSPEEAAVTLAKGNDPRSFHNLEQAYDRQFPNLKGKDLGSQTLRELLTPADTRFSEGSSG
ncbi:hypothetical protein V1T76_08270 [Roseibium sp. FZY0029]|uniref:hypothetical protein n=1 Tax=Roseibium sp. FZY0029 TaxID=3116647 RepID=UPI002EA8C522|nr:hypothetical protein [Roseibium sp. FZY0029]